VEPEFWHRVEDLYHRALELDESRRAEFIEVSCGPDLVLRAEVESLLAQEKKAENFIETPAIGVLSQLVANESRAAEKDAGDLRGCTVSHYHVLEKLGGGGMGVVYKAEDTRLHRFVALKFLPEHLSRDPQWLTRFRREAQAASALNHPNISTIYDIGEDNGHAFIAMEFLQGQTLKQMVGKKPLTTAQILEIGADVADALEAAHRNGIVHRDVKPANIFVCEGGHAKLLDFGVAKVTREFVGSGGSAADSIALRQDLTETGVALGTAAYMSPEQVRGEELDGRTDIFSLGVVLYEMATGTPPFKGNTSGAVSAAILHDSPPPVSFLNPTLLPSVATLIAKALEKDRDLRYRSGADLSADLKRLTSEIDSGKVRTPKQRFLPLQSRALWGIGFSILLVAALAYRLHSTRLSLTDRDTVVLTDFVNKTEDPVFSDALKPALSSELGQSPFLNVLPERKMKDTLRSMGRPVNTPVSLDLGREICQRTGSTALISGSISSLGTSYLITLKAIACRTGDILAEEQDRAASRESVLKVLAGASSSFRRKLGESLPSLQKFEPPLEATTTSLEALKSYNIAVRTREKGDDQAAIPMFFKAIELDPNFPLAYAELAVSYSDIFEQSHSIENAAKAYELRERASEREKLQISTIYFRQIGNQEKAIEAFQQWIADYPRDLDPYIRLGIAYSDLGQYNGTRAILQRALKLAPDEAHIYTNLSWAELDLNHFDEAKSYLDAALARKPDDFFAHDYLYTLAFLEGDEARMQEQMRWALGKPDEDIMLSMHSDTEAYFGRLRNAREFTRKSVDSAVHANSNEAAAYWNVNGALREAELGNPAEARRAVAAALALSKGVAVKIVAALTLARIGDPQAEVIAKQLAHDYPTNLLLNSYWLPTIRAEILIRRGRPAEAIAQLQVATPYELGIAWMFVNYLYPAYVRGQAYLAQHDGRAAAAEFQKVIDHSGIVENFVTGSLAHLEIARSYVASGDTVAAKAAYENFFRLWKDADRDIPILQQAKAEYARLP
jgi:eukaryotic-like serine/threonine-protein kinase